MRTSISLIVTLGLLSAAGAQAADLGEVTVTAPAITTIGRDATGTPIRQLSGSVQLHYNPISLTTNSGRALLDDRVADAARALCSANGAFSNVDDDYNCVRGAVAGARAQLDAATAEVNVRLAQGYPVPVG